MSSEKIFPKKLADDLLEKVIDFLKSEKIIFDKHRVLISIVSVSEKEIKKLNSQYRNKHEVTDILSFGYVSDQEKLEGDLILCWEIIQKNAREDSIKSNQELAKNLIHGCLHLTGQEHSKKMFALQNKFLVENYND
ncbi:MAG: rRNA maturation RNase YbeY [Candidatus Moranbacteria bacterium]|nr:rRNA maturation RNase YbeY [Candidatus Moranbacteria bacterium]